MHRETPVLESHFSAVADLRPATLLKRESNTVVFCEYCEIFKKASFIEHLLCCIKSIILHKPGNQFSLYRACLESFIFEKLK